MSLGYRADAATLADKYGVAPLPVLDKETGKRLYDRRVRDAAEYDDAVLLSLVNLSVTRGSEWSYDQVIRYIQEERVVSIECFDDSRIDDQREYIVKIVNGQGDDSRVAFYEGAGLDVVGLYSHLLDEVWAVVCWDESRFTLGVNQSFCEAALFSTDRTNRAEAVRNLSQHTSETTTDTSPEDRDP